MSVREITSPRTRWIVQIQDSDVIVFAIRVALIVVLWLYLNVGQARPEGVRLPISIALMIAMIYSGSVAVGWWLIVRLRQRQSSGPNLVEPMFWQRPLGLVVDLVLITTALYSFGQMSDNTAYYVTLYQFYYLVILVAAVWYRLAGAMIVASISVLLWLLIRPVIDPLATFPPSLVDLCWVSGSPFLLLVAMVAGYLVSARERESQRAAQLDQELMLGRQLQDTMLPPRLPAIPGFDVGKGFEPATRIGGDLYDVMELSPGRYMVCLGDMAGKSVRGLVHLSMVHSHIRAAAREGMCPADMATHVNRHAYDALQPEGYAGVFIGILDADNGSLSFANCGHLPPVLLRGGHEQDALELATGGTVIGGVSDSHYQQSQVTIHPGDYLLLYTDGIAQARAPRGELFGQKRLLQVAVEAGPDAQTMADAVLRASQRFSGRAGADDATVLVFRRLADAEPLPEETEVGD